MQGYKGRTGTFVPPAVITPNGCHLPQRAPAANGYILIQPVAVFRGKAQKNEPNKEKDGFQSAHRVVCYLTKSEDDVHNLLYRGYHASHLCHQRGCINPDHLVVETEDVNYSRKMCSTKVHTKTSVNGRDYLANAEDCPHSPPCVIRLETRAAIEL
ncbi:zinc-binding loop region of homing endonuclease-domain-containing protein [Lipomyces doorenjongii]